MIGDMNFYLWTMKRPLFLRIAIQEHWFVGFFFFCEKNCWVVNKRSVLIRSIRNKRISTEMGVVICNMKIRILYDFSVCFTAKTARCSAVFLRVIPAVEVINAENEISLVFCVPSQKS